MSRSRTGWLLLIVGAPFLGLVGSVALGVYFNVLPIGLLVGLVLAGALGTWSYKLFGVPGGTLGDELLDDLTGEDSSERSARQLIAEEEPALGNRSPDPTAWDR
ncbi:MAG: hypothetical protein ACHQ16_04885 [Candidatus Lutacidiplasmatales archaeon]